MRRFFILLSTITVLSISSFTVFISYQVIANTLSSNRMEIGEIDKSLPEKEIRNYYAKMEPLILKYFGPPFSNFKINIKIDIDEKTQSPADIDPKNRTLILKRQAREYLQGVRISKQDSLKIIYGTMEHELSHALYIYKDFCIDFSGKWVYEGWARFLGDLIHAEINNTPLSISPYLAYYQDRNLMMGSGGYTVARLPENQGLTYDKATVSHFLLTAAASTNDLDFYKRLNSKIYEYLENKKFEELPPGMKQPLGVKIEKGLTFDEYKNILRPFLAGVKVDGIDAYSWYFDNIEFSSNPKTGRLVGINVVYNLKNEPEKLVAYIFDRNKTIEGYEEKPVTSVKLNINLKNSYGKIVFEKTQMVNSQGRIELQLSPDISSGAYQVLAFYINNPAINNKTFFIKIPRIENKESYLYGVLFDENNDLVNGNFSSLIKSNFNFIYKDNGMFILDVPLSVKNVNLDFLGRTYEVTKGPFSRIYALKLDKNQLKAAGLKNEMESEAGKIKVQELEENTGSQPLKGKNIIYQIIEWLKRLIKIR